MDYSDEHIKLARFAKALGHPARVKIMEILANQSCCYSGDIFEELPIARSTLSQPLKELKDSGLIQGEISPPKIKYCVNADNWVQAKKLIDNLFIDRNISC
mgnify:FL=1